MAKADWGLGTELKATEATALVGSASGISSTDVSWLVSSYFSEGG